MQLASIAVLIMHLQVLMFDLHIEKLLDLLTLSHVELLHSKDNTIYALPSQLVMRTQCRTADAHSCQFATEALPMIQTQAVSAQAHTNLETPNIIAHAFIIAVCTFGPL